MEDELKKIIAEATEDATDEYAGDTTATPLPKAPQHEEVADGNAQPRPKWIPKPKPPKTEEDYRAIAILDKLRKGEGEMKPEGLPLACIVKVLDYTEVPKANDAYAMVTVYGPDDKMWRMCVNRGTVAPGDEVLFISEEAALPIEDRWRDELVCSLKERVYKFGFGIKIRRLVPHVKRNIYIHNCGVLYPLDDFARELRKVKIGEDCSRQLNLDNNVELKARQNMKKPKPVKPEDEIDTTAMPAPAVIKARRREELEKRRAKIAKRAAKRAAKGMPPAKYAKKKTEEPVLKGKATFKFLDKIRFFRVEPGTPIRVSKKNRE